MTDITKHPKIVAFFNARGGIQPKFIDVWPGPDATLDNMVDEFIRVVEDMEKHPENFKSVSPDEIDGDLDQRSISEWLDDINKKEF